VSVSICCDEDTVTLQVSDSGMGIPAADVPNLFADFYRASNARQSDVEGSGVGLAGVKELVERFGGNMTLDSVENEGSTFSVHLQSAEPAQ
jgi:signal transduction histidine kinase